MGYYEIIIIYSKDCGDVTSFRHDDFINDENDIVTQAIKEGFLGEENRKYVRWARAVSKYEYNYIRFK